MKVESTNYSILNIFCLPFYVFLIYFTLFSSRPIGEWALVITTSPLFLALFFKANRRIIFEETSLHVCFFNKTTRSLSYEDILSFDISTQIPSIRYGNYHNSYIVGCRIQCKDKKTISFDEDSPEKMIELIKFLMDHSPHLNSLENKRKLHPLYHSSSFRQKNQVE